MSGAERQLPDEAERHLPDEAARTDIDSDLDTNILVEAGAGSGKTTSLLRRMVALIRSGTATASEIAAVTFTRKAAGELRERFQVELEQVLAAEAPGSGEGARLRQALSSLDQLFIGTIHAFCARLLRERPLEARLDPGFQELTEEASYKLVTGFWAAHLERLAADAHPILAPARGGRAAPQAARGSVQRSLRAPRRGVPRRRRPPAGSGGHHRRA